ncbi:DUF7916 family protein [Candidatus Stoquefichus sp. SB1]|uniref:DUF7916 family protein n=1 Tax=Candidatus Stoquefichus sp. SB1 TaxID=1658109 RepID=UPI00067F4A86|nr:hypothetical protein [Candidatus Stoquefichus sp. SB1]
MPRRLISSTRSEIRTMTAKQLKDSIRACEGRVILSQNYVGHSPLLEGTTNAELAESMGADMVFFNGYPMDETIEIPAFQVDVYKDGQYVHESYRLKEMKTLTKGPLGVYLECGVGDDPSASTSTQAGTSLIRRERVASDENLKKLIDEDVDFVVLAGNPGTGTSMETIIDATKRAKAILGDQVMIWAGKWEDGVKEKVLGDPLRKDSKEVIAKLIDAGADVICLPMPGSRTGVTVESMRELVTFVHEYGDKSTLAMSFLDGSVEGSDEGTVRLCGLMSKQTGADIHAIGDAGCSGMSTPEDIYQLAMTIKGRRLTWLKTAAGFR